MMSEDSGNNSDNRGGDTDGNDNNDSGLVASATVMVIATREVLLDWAKNVGKQLGFVIIIRRSDCGSKGRGSKGRQLAILVCEMSGKYKPYKPVLVRKGTGTKEVRGDQNHEPVETLVGHAYARRLTSQENDMVGKIVDNRVKPDNMLLALKDPQNLTTIRQVYNERMTHIRAKRGQLPEMQYLMRLLEEDSYSHIPYNSSLAMPIPYC
ncbi:uncharacterized protein LOC130725544 [Lotus japonicus]|uniref:uncharacterized protein LOC130725544 n=1 Tax=Lotus japonicus TaxID=34305 RepID=UPI00258DFF8E|nr:uncharacterized protein LOC130725544 [Lotus japonicus]